jgi:mannosyltransferase
VILGNSNSRFSGVTSTMLQVLPEQMRRMRLAVMGAHNLPPGVPSLGFIEVARLARRPLADGRPRVFHARRNDEMIQALLLRRVFRADLRIVFTSTAQRHHTGMTNWLMKRMDGRLSTCDAAASYMKHPPDRIIPHGVDTERFHPAADRAAAWDALGLPGRRGIGVFGRVRSQKGVDVLLEAVLPILHDHPEFTVVVVGEVTPGARAFAQGLERLVADAGLSDRVVFLGKQPFERIPELFRAMSIVTALSRNEGFGLTVLEAMSSGVPVVASEAGAWPEIVEDGVDGWLVPVGDVTATRDRLRALMAEPDGLDPMGARGRSKVLARFTVEREAHALCEYYAELARAGTGGADPAR